MKHMLGTSKVNLPKREIGILNSKSLKIVFN
jgi:hypothetical protein